MKIIKILLIAFILWLVPIAGYADDVYKDGHVGLPVTVTIFAPVPALDNNVTCNKDVSFNIKKTRTIKNSLYYTIYDITVNEPGTFIFTIKEHTLTNIINIHVLITDHEYENKEVKATCIKEGYTEYKCKYDNCSDSYKENIQSPLEHFAVKKKAIPAKIKESGLTEGEYCKHCGEILIPQKKIPRINTVVLKINKYFYDGNRKKPQFNIKDSNGKLLNPGVDYIVQYTNTKGKTVKTVNVGSYIAVAKFQGNYSGTVSKKFTIYPKKTYVKKLTKGRNTVTVKWNKVTSQITGYNIRYSTSAKMLNAKTISIKNKNITSKQIKKLKSKKNYYVQVRTYKKIGSSYYYSGWSDKKLVRTK